MNGECLVKENYLYLGPGGPICIKKPFDIKNFDYIFYDMETLTKSQNWAYTQLAVCDSESNYKFSDLPTPAEGKRAIIQINIKSIISDDLTFLIQVARENDKMGSYNIYRIWLE